MLYKVQMQDKLDSQYNSGGFQSPTWHRPRRSIQLLPTWRIW